MDRQERKEDDPEFSETLRTGNNPKYPLFTSHTTPGAIEQHAFGRVDLEPVQLSSVLRICPAAE